MNHLTRAIVLAGAVTLGNGLGSVTGAADHLLAAETGSAPVSSAVQANSDFAMDLYQQLAKEHAGENLFFSPYSMSVALTMTAEGARQETAAEMGKVLRFPEAARNTGDDAQLIPWNTALIHNGMKDLYTRFNPKPASPELLAQIEEKRKELAADTAEEERIQKEFDPSLSEKAWGKWNDRLTAQRAKSEQARTEFNALSEKANPYELRVANALWGEKTYPLRKSYLDTINEFYGSGAAEPVDFIHNFEAVRLQINGWAEKQTNDRIKDLLPAGSLDDSTRLVLCNAIYFKGEWSIPFDAKDTKPGDFLTPGSKVPVSMMNRDDVKGARYGAFDADGSFFSTPRMRSFTDGNQNFYPDKAGFLMAELPYKGRDLSMVVMVPMDANGLGELEKKLSSANLQSWIGKLEGRSVNIQMPKFKMETNYPEMKESLQAMGMVRAFVDPRDPAHGAQFDGMCASEDPRLKLYISKVCHKAFVEVNEKGTEAAAATAVMMAVAMAARDEPFTPTFRADKPFVFAIRDVQTGTILFLGRVMNPGK